jgi:alpha-tubulin suppressor-like RCC1 family protein
LAGVTAVAGGGEHSLALKVDGTVWAWGLNASGQLGDGARTSRATPAQVSGLNEVTAIAAGYYHSLALRRDGMVWSWGSNEFGQLGDGSLEDRALPVLVAGLSDVTRIACGYDHCLALKDDGTVWAWGANVYGMLGDGLQEAYSPVPVPVSGLDSVRAIAAGGLHSLALRSDRTLWSWGANSNGQLGDGTTVDRAAPVQVGAIHIAITSIAGGGGFSLAASTTLPWDLNGDHMINILDITLLGPNYGKTGEPGALVGDINRDGVVNVLDVTILGAHFGETY